LCYDPLRLIPCFPICSSCSGSSWPPGSLWESGGHFFLKFFFGFENFFWLKNGTIRCPRLKELVVFFRSDLGRFFFAAEGWLYLRYQVLRKKWAFLKKKFGWKFFLAGNFFWLEIFFGWKFFLAENFVLFFLVHISSSACFHPDFDTCGVRKVTTGIMGKGGAIFCLLTD
jgi:hypothetical protein